MALADGAIATQRKMAAAESLLSALAGEEARWSKQMEAFDSETNCLIGELYSTVDFPKTASLHGEFICRSVAAAGDCAVVAGFVSYLGPFNKDFRQQLLSRFRNQCSSLGIPLTPELNMTTFLVEDSELAEWIKQVGSQPENTREYFVHLHTCLNSTYLVVGLANGRAFRTKWYHRHTSKAISVVD